MTGLVRMVRLVVRAKRMARFLVPLSVIASAGVGTAAGAQDMPPAVSPLRVDLDMNGVNLVDGKTTIDTPVLSVPGAPHLKFDRVQNAAPYIVGQNSGGAGDYAQGNYTVHTGTGTSESFECFDFDCTSVTGTGSILVGRQFRQAGTGAVWHFTLKHVAATATSTKSQYYASSIDYPDGETITYSYGTATLAGDPYNRIFYRPVQITSNLGYYIRISYQSNDFNSSGWGSVAQASIYNSSDPMTPLGRLTYSGGTITDLGGRVFSCTGCNNALGTDIETDAGSLSLPGEASPAKQVTQSASAPLVGSVTKDGVLWTYTYANPVYQGASLGYTYDSVSVTGPNGYHQVYDMTTKALRNTITGVTDSLGRSTAYTFDTAYRPTQVVYPEGNQVSVAYDEFGNIFSKTTRAKLGSGLADITETAQYPTTTCASSGYPVLCYRPQWVRDGLGRQTDFVYNNQGQLIEQTDPADASGVRRKTYITYDATTGISRKSVVRVCGDITTCGTANEIRTEYEYWGNTFLPSVVRKIDAARGVTLTTTFAYDNAGRVTMEDGPLTGLDDATYYRYDTFGRKTWEIGPLGANGVRMAKRFTYRPSDDKVTKVETGTVPDAGSYALTVLSQTDTTYDSRRNPIREALSSAGTTYSVVDKSFDMSNRLECQTVRMNAAVFASLPSTACTASTLDPQQGPDRITHNIYDAAGQLLKVQKAYGTSLQQDYATYTYSLNGKQASVTDANGNLATMSYDGFDRLAKWTFPSKTSPGSVNTADYEAYTYDAVGNRTSLRKRDGSTLTYSYDNLNRVTRKTVPERAGLSVIHTRDVFYGYDIMGLETYARFDSASGEGITNSYDGFGRLLTTTINMNGVSRTLSYQYDAAGNRTRLTHPDGVPYTYQYDALDRLTMVSDPTFGLYGITYNSRGLPATINRSGVGTFGYDAVGRLTSYHQDFAGAPNDWASTVNDVDWTFSYNPAGQVTSQSRSNDVYAWTDHVNVDRGYTVNGLNQYSAAGGATFAYDANGNLTSDGSTTYTYDVENRLVAASGAKSATLRYDPLGRLYEVSSPSGTTRFLYDGNALIAEYAASGALLRRYVHGVGDDVPFAWIEGATIDYSQYRSLYGDRQGSIYAMVNTSGQVTGINTYDEYGIPGAPGPGVNQGRFRYTGQAWLPELGMYYYKARIYSPTLGRFLQTDPVGYEGGINLYAYVGNDPINETDPSGNCPNACVGNDGQLQGMDATQATASRLPQQTQRIPANAAKATPAQGAKPKSNNDRKNHGRSTGAEVIGAVGESQSAFARAGEKIGVAANNAGIRALKWLGATAAAGASLLTYAEQRAQGKSQADAVNNTAGQTVANAAAAGLGAMLGSPGGTAGEFVGAVSVSFVTDRLGITEGAGDLAQRTFGTSRNEGDSCDKCMVPEF